MKEKPSDFDILDGKLLSYSGIENEVIIPEGVTVIGENAFNSCEFLTKVTLCLSAEEIGESAFANCPNLREAIFPSNGKLRELGESAFAGCGFESLALPATVRTIGNEAFYGNRKLKFLTVPSGVKTIGNSAFRHCEELLSVYVPESVETIKRSAFADCDKLTVKTPLTQKPEKWDIAWNGNGETCCEVLWSCPKDEREIAFTPETKNGGKNAELLNVSSKEYEIFNGELVKVRIKQSEFAVPEGVTAIGWSVFKGNQILKKITVTKTVAKIGSYAFANCENLTTVVFEEGSELEEIGKNAFLNCKKLRWVLWNDNTRLFKIADQAFCGCSSLCDVKLPSAVKYVGKFAFYNTSITSVSVSKNIEHIGECAFCSVKTKNIALDENALLLDEYVADKTKTKRMSPHSSPLKIRVPFSKEETPNGWDVFWHGGSDVFWNYNEFFKYETSVLCSRVIAVYGANTNLELFNGGNLAVGKRVFRKSDVECVKTVPAKLFRKGRICITLRKKSTERTAWETLRKGKTVKGAHYDEIVFFDRSQNDALDPLISAFKQNGIYAEKDAAKKKIKD